MASCELPRGSRHCGRAADLSIAALFLRWGKLLVGGLGAGGRLRFSGPRFGVDRESKASRVSGRNRRRVADATDGLLEASSSAP